MADKSKDILYIDVDDEITAIIDKVQASEGKVLALVLPKRAAVLQSVVNMKLLKRSADAAKKRLVLITSEAGLLPLAGAVGIYVAKSLQSRPELPTAPQVDDQPEELSEDEPLAAEDTGRPVGELAGAGALGAAGAAAADEDETIELDNDEPEAEATPAVAAGAAAFTPKPKKNKKLMVPNFERFRLLLVLGAALLIGLGVLAYFAFAVWPKAVINIQTDATNVNTNVTFTADTEATSVDLDNKVVPAKQVQSQKTVSQSVPATGQKNAGDKASGPVSLSIPCSKVQGQEMIPAGTGVSKGSLTYITQTDATLDTANFKNGCTFTATTTIKAIQGGASYNQSSGTSFTLATSSEGDYDAQNITVTATSDITGGTDNFVKVVAQSDIDAAKQKLTDQNSDTIKQDLQQQLEQQGYYALLTTFSTGTPTVTTSADPGDTADTVTVNEALTSTMLGIKKQDLKGLIDDNIKNQIDTGKQGILDEGLTHGIFKLLSSTDTTAKVNVQTTATVGPDIDVNAIKQQVAGKQAGEIRSTLENDPDVTQVDVHMSPFWVTKAPKNPNKIIVHIAKPTKTVGNANAG